MLKLDTTTRKIQAVLSGAITTNQLPCMVSYSDDNGTTYVGGTQLTNTNSTTAVDICAAPGASTVRDIDYLSIRNRDTAAATVTVMLDDNGTDYEIVKATLAVGDQLVYTHGAGWRVTDADGNLKTGASSSGSSSTTPSEPGGRLTLTSGTPVMTSDVSNSTSIYYTPYINDKIPIYDGSSWTMTTFSELTNTTTDNTKNPAAVVASSNYDLFVWSDSGTLRLGRGPAWSSATARGTGAGTTELERVNGILVNKISITNGPSAQRGTYVGTVRSDASNTIDWELGGSDAGGDPGFLYVWNMYNRVDVSVVVNDNTNSWTYAGNGTYQATNNSTSNRVSFVLGMNEDIVSAICTGNGTPPTSTRATMGVQLDGVTGPPNGAYVASIGLGTSHDLQGLGFWAGFAGLGYHFISSIESTESASTTTWYGDNNRPIYFKQGLQVMGRF